MDAQSYNTGLAELRTLRDQIKKTTAALARLETERSKAITALADYDKAKADRIAPAAGISVAETVAIAPQLAPDSLADSPAAAPTDPPPGPSTDAAAHDAAPAAQQAPAPPPGAGQDPPAAVGVPRALPSLPEDTETGRWFTHTPGLISQRPNFMQRPRSTVFLDTATGVLVHRDHTTRLDLGDQSAAAILTAVFHTVPDSVERIYITAGDPWHHDADRYPYLRDAVAAWLNAPVPGWRTDTGQGKDRLAGHFVHVRNPVGRYQRDDGKHRVEIRSAGEWFDLEDGDDPAIVRDTFLLLWQELRRHWPDAVIMGSPSQTGRDLWTRTIPERGKYADGYPVLSEELRGLLHATAGQGRNELITPPRIPAQLPGLLEYDRTFAYAKHTWKSPVGTPRRITPRTFASWTAQEQTNALYGCGHWHVRVTVPDGWNHVGILPAPAPGERAWHYPHTPGTTFTTWAGGPEVHAALNNPIQPWKVEILDGILWEAGKPLTDWARKLKDTWANLAAQEHFQGDERNKRPAHLASRAVRAILLYGIGSFAQRPRMVTGTTPRSMERDVPADAEIIGFDDNVITWQQPTGFAWDPNAHPEWAATIWSGARAALLTQYHRDEDTYAGALHAAPGSVAAFRTDAVYLTSAQNWPHRQQPGDYLLKGHLTGPLTAPDSEENLLALRDAGRIALAASRKET
ncbi:hypothetical protein [Streptomyces sp. NBC_00258]|uniref:hypothetical protein n=2 Tax=Streptomyces sp. NBC_00258 TaxID=2903642 RepID=UPI00324BAD4E